MLGPKERKERSLGEHLHLKATRCQSPKCALVRKPYKPGAHGKGGRVKALSDFGKQLKETQKFKLVYGVDGRNLKQIFDKASEAKGSTGSKFIELLESRIDNVVFRLGIAGSRAMARKMVVHGHIVINGKNNRAPGYVTEVGDIITIRTESREKAPFKELREALKTYNAPTWVTMDAEKLEGRVVAAPDTTVVPFEINLLVESFSK